MARPADPANDDFSRETRGWRAIFWNAREVRAGWSFLLFTLLYLLLGAGLTFVLRALLHDLPDGWTPGVLSLSEAVSLLAVVVAVAVMARIERRSFAVYGISLGASAGRRFGEGALWGIGASAATILAIAAAGGYSVSGFALEGGALARSALGWGIAFHVINDIGFANVFPVGLALYSRASPRALAGVMIGVYYVHLFACNMLVGRLGGFLEQMEAGRFWLMHAGLVAIGSAGLLAIRSFAGRILAPTDDEPAQAPA